MWYRVHRAQSAVDFNPRGCQTPQRPTSTTTVPLAQMGHFSFYSVREAPRATRLRQDTAENSILLPSYLFLRIVVLILTVVIEVYDSTGLALEIIDHLAIIDSFFSSVADAVILLCLVELALSFLSALDNDIAYHRIIHYSNLVAISVLLVLAVAALGDDESWLIKSDYGRLRVSRTTPSNLYGAYNIIYWIASIAAVFLSSFVLYSSVRKKHMRSVSKAP
jgi:hypothetical protein